MHSRFGPASAEGAIPLGLPWRPRNHESIALIHNGRSLRVGDVLAAARNALSAIQSFIARNGGRRPNLLLPSKDPLTFITGMIAAAWAGAACVPFREDTMDLEGLLGPVSPNAVLRCRDGDWCLDTLQDNSAAEPRHGQVLMLTSGSTGAPKAVALDHHHIVMNATMAGTVSEIGRCSHWAIEIDMSFMSAVSHMVMAWQFDLPLIHLDTADEQTVKTAFSDGKTGYGGSPIGLLQMTERMDRGPGPSVATSSGDFLTPPMIDRLRECFPGMRLNKIYGLTELGGRFCCLPHDRMAGREICAGAALPGFSARINRESPGDAVGTIEAFTPTLAHGYYLADGQFECFPRGWFSTGDIGSMDDEGFVTVVGREDDVFKVGGEKVDRASIEDALSDLIEKSEYCVLAVRHPLIGQTPVLFVGTRGCEPSVSMKQVISHLKSRLPSRFLPTRIVNCDQGLPRLENGKVDRTRLRTLAAARSQVEG